MRGSSLLVFVVALGYVAFLGGCTPQNAEFKPYEGESEVTDAHEHEHEHGPHDGHVIELGDEEYHAELVFDGASRKITIYVLDAALKNAVAIEQSEISLNLTVDGKPVQLKLAAAPQEGEADGKSSRFELAGEQLPEAIHDEEDIAGRLNLDIAGKPYVGEISHDHDHEHEHEHGDDEKDME